MDEAEFRRKFAALDARTEDLARQKTLVHKYEEEALEAYDNARMWTYRMQDMCAGNPDMWARMQDSFNMAVDTYSQTMQTVDDQRARTDAARRALEKERDDLSAAYSRQKRR